MTDARDVFLTIGKGTYTIRTPLRNDELDRIKALIDEACGSVVKEATQDDLLMLTCLRLAYRLDSVSLKLNDVLMRIEGDSHD